MVNVARVCADALVDEPFATLGRGSTVFDDMPLVEQALNDRDRGVPEPAHPPKHAISEQTKTKHAENETEHHYASEKKRRDEQRKSFYSTPGCESGSITIEKIGPIRSDSGQTRYYGTTVAEPGVVSEAKAPFGRFDIEVAPEYTAEPENPVTSP